jgi:hypothetical protein
VSLLSFLSVVVHHVDRAVLAEGTAARNHGGLWGQPDADLLGDLKGRVDPWGRNRTRAQILEENWRKNQPVIFWTEGGAPRVG